MINKKVNNYFLILFSILPITIVSGPAVSLINILLIDLSFLVLILLLVCCWTRDGPPLSNIRAMPWAQLCILASLELHVVVEGVGVVVTEVHRQFQSLKFAEHLDMVACATDAVECLVACCH